MYPVLLIAALLQDPPALTIAEIKVDANHDTIPDRLDQTVKTRGVVTAGTGDLRSEMLEIVIQDETGGIYLFASKPPDPYERGELIEVIGKVAQYRGKEELVDPT